MSQRICNAKNCEKPIPIYSRYCLIHEDEALTPDVVIISSQPTSTESCCDCECCECKCCECECCDCECGDCDCFGDD